MKPPAITRELLEYLRSVYPVRHPKLSTPDREVWWQAGASSVVDHLQSLKDQQDEASIATALETEKT